jgi:hypothetical protein
MLVAAGFVQAAIILTVLRLAGGARETWVIVPGLVPVFLICNPIATVILTIMMDRTAAGSEDTDFTAQYSLYSFMGFHSGAVALQIGGAAGYKVLVLIVAGLALVAGFLALQLYREEPPVGTTAPPYGPA